MHLNLQLTTRVEGAWPRRVCSNQEHKREKLDFIKPHLSRPAMNYGLKLDTSAFSWFLDTSERISLRDKRILLRLIVLISITKSNSVTDRIDRIRLKSLTDLFST